MCNYYLINFDKFPAAGGQFSTVAGGQFSTVVGGQFSTAIGGQFLI